MLHNANIYMILLLLIMTLLVIAAEDSKRLSTDNYTYTKVISRSQSLW